MSVGRAKGTGARLAGDFGSTNTSIGFSQAMRAIFFAILFFYGCSFSSGEDVYDRGFDLDVSIVQSGDPVRIDFNDNVWWVEIDDVPFEFVYREHGSGAGAPLHACVAANTEILGQFATGRPTSSSSCIAPGTGMAPSGDIHSGWDLMLAKGEAHNYFSLERSRMVGNRERRIPIRSIQTRTGGEIPPRVLYVAVFVDKNVNEIIDRGEVGLFGLRIRQPLEPTDASVSSLLQTRKDIQRECIIEVELSTAGLITSIDPIQCPDQSMRVRAISSLKKAQPLPVPSDPAVFEGIRRVQFRFKP